ncbi:antimicrobial peptide ABC transporter permease [Cupriavidus basilensis OR16]|uniref:Antimicrobial peptide ABC transporter permease n=2 Tax=Cupriavidus basilensis TaxID=68895 RepID=H1SH07_9BURK|nr:antimicrobial peptide ABC transporter permease [Cupriavidus basilensis OR16]
MLMLSMAARSAWNRRYNLLLMLLAIAMSVAMLLGVERIRHAVRASFAQSVSGTDLVVGARSSPIQLMLYTVFHLGGAANNMQWDSAERLARHPAVAWTIPLSLGDSHRGFPVLATTASYFTHYRYGDRHVLVLAQGRPFAALFDAVLGAEVASRLGYRVGDRIVLSHGDSDDGGPEHADHGHHAEHGDKPFVVSGILARTGTPVDRTVHIGLAAMQAIHLGWESGVPLPGLAILPEQVRKFDLTPRSLTGVLVGLKHRSQVFAMQREIAEDPHEPLMAVLPGVALDALWGVIGVAERAMLLVSALVVVVGLAGLASSILAALGERRRELAILRAVGARPRDLLAMLALEGLVVMAAGALLGLALLSALAAGFGPYLASTFGVALQAAWPTPGEWPLFAIVVAAGFCVSLLPGWRAYRLSLADGLMPAI